MTDAAGELLSLDVRGLAVAAKVWGPLDGRPVLALHGWLDNANTFDGLAPLVPGVRLVAIDLPGHGLSAHRPACAGYGFVDWVTEVLAVSRALGWERFSLLGHSMGAAIASMVAGTLPALVERLALLEGLAPITVPAAEAAEHLALWVVHDRRRAGQTPRVYASFEEAAGRLAATTGMSPASALHLTERGARADRGGVVWRWDPRLRGLSPFRMSEEQVASFLKRVACPVLLVRARHASTWDKAQMRERLALVPRARVVDVDGSHHVHLDAPERVAPFVAPFLRGDD